MPRYKVWLCGDTDTAVFAVPHPECPNAQEHCPCPVGYIEWHHWAERQKLIFNQKKCPGCGFWVILVPKEEK